MQTLALLDTIIGLVFIYAMFSVLCSTLVEWTSALTLLRARVLEVSVAKLLGAALTKQFNAHPMIDALQLQRHASRTRYPDYIPPETFALTFMELTLDFTPGAAGAPGSVAVKGQLDGGSEQLARALMQGTNNVGPVQARIERWFGDTMEIASGRYKRVAQLYAIGIALLITFAFDLDSVHILTTLYANAPLRSDIVATAVNRAKLDTLRMSDVDPLLLPIGQRLRDAGKGTNANPVVAIAGYLMTIIALSFGAPFWFDLLKKLVNLRQSGTPPDERRPVVVAR